MLLALCGALTVMGRPSQAPPTDAGVTPPANEAAAAASVRSDPDAPAPSDKPSMPEQLAVEALPAEALAQIAAIRDYTLDFDHPGFYAVVEHVRRHGVRGATPDVQPLADWRELAERPRAFRGQPVTITARVGHNRAWALPSRPRLGTLHQLELFDPRQPIAITAILTGAAEDIPIASEITLTGYFVMMRSYLTTGGQTRQAALLVADGPATLLRAAPPANTPLLGRGDALTGVITAVAAGLLIALLLLRRAARGRTATRLAAALRTREDDTWIEEAADPASSPHPADAPRAPGESRMEPPDRKASTPAAPGADDRPRPGSGGA